MTLWINFLWNNCYINPARLPLLHVKTGALAIVKLGLTAGWPAMSAGRWVDENIVK